ncbi:MAG: TauD/TfdA family dioxygenase [Stellaceae bacterium]
MKRQRIEVRPTGAALGDDIEGLDLAQALSSDAVEAIKQAWADHLVLRFRSQQLDNDQLMRFSSKATGRIDGRKPPFR